MQLHAITSDVRQKALSLGFDACGFARAEPLDEAARRLEEWLSRGRHGEMHWMEQHFDKRVNPALLVEGTRSIISVIGSYHFPENEELDSSSGPKIAKYARGRDYHKVFKKRLHQLLDYLGERIGKIHGRAFVDSAPVMDKEWARRAGLGWIGKNSNLLNRSHGSWFLIGELFVDVPFIYDSPVTDHCGSCTRCIDACPTGAIYQPYRVDATRCISYLTIELKDAIPAEYHDGLGEWVFGCDICQDVCPWNRKAETGTIGDLRPRPKMVRDDLSFWKNLSQQEYEELFNGTPVRRARYPRFVENTGIVIRNLEKQQRENE